MDSAPVFLTPRQLMQRWKYSIVPGTLANWRSQKKGPPYQKIGSKVVYPLAELEAWERLNVVSVSGTDSKT